VAENGKKERGLSQGYIEYTEFHLDYCKEKSGYEKRQRMGTNRERE
jgi:hypothetical protein